MKVSKTELSDQARHLLAVSEYNAAVSPGVLAKMAGMRERAVRQIFSDWESRGIVVGRAPLIDLTPLGLVEYSLFLRMAPPSRARVDGFLRVLTKSKGVSWIGKLRGEFDLGVSVFARDPRDISRLLSAAVAASGVRVEQQVLTVRERSTFYARKYLAPTKTIPAGPSFGRPASRGVLDEAEAVVLRTLARRGVISHREIERTTGIPQATISRKIRKLQDDNVVVGYLYRYNLANAGVLSHQLFITLADRSIVPELETYAAKHPHISQFGVVFGGWDVELQYDYPLESAGMLEVDDLFSKFGQSFVRVRTVEIAERTHYAGYPF